MSLLEDVVGKCVKLGRMRYEPSVWGWAWVERICDVPRTKGVYFLVSPRGIEKVGSARGVNGMKRRMSDYVRKCSRLRVEDRTCVLWDRVMTGEMAGVEVDVYYIGVEDTYVRASTPLGEVELEAGIVLGLEAHYFKRAVSEGEPMRLCGSAP